VSTVADDISLLAETFWILLELRMMEMVTTGAIRRAKLQSNRHHQQTNTQLFRLLTLGMVAKPRYLQFEQSDGH